MLSFVTRRLLVSVPVLLLSSFLVFLLVAAAGDPLADLRGRNPPVPETVIKARESALWINHPLPNRYWHWLTGIVHGDFGPSIKGLDIGSDLGHRMLVTGRMVVLAMFVAVLLAILTGVLSAVRQYSGLDYTFTFAGFLFLSMPVFWFAALLKEFLAIKFNDALGKTVVYTIGDSTPDLPGNFFTRLPNYAGHLVLPTIALAAITYASWSRYQRSAMLDVLSSDYIRLARAKGLSQRRVMVRHALRTALIPLTTIVAVDIGATLGGAVITEQVFAWHGMGEMLINSVTDQDVNRTLAWLMVAGVVVILANLIADVLYAFLDPRIRYG
jgi:peptide/nickel transport system permease protein